MNKTVESRIQDLQSAFVIMQKNQHVLHENFERLRDTTEKMFELVQTMRGQLKPTPISGRN